ncbi:MAG: DUF1360 domain-containing protein [Proteobacteria bacterium]|nr:DUF1360 domain-containing protein [Pseudomonadota bacterium]
MSLYLFFVAGFAITNAVVFLHIGHCFRRLVSGLSDENFYSKAEASLSGFRQIYLGRLVRCHACFGFWIGVALSVLLGGIAAHQVDLSHWWLGSILDGAMLSGFNFAVWILLKKLGAEEL